MDEDLGTALEQLNLEYAEYDGADKGEGDIGGYDAQLTDERTKGHGNPPKVSIVASRHNAQGSDRFHPKKSAVLSLRFIPATHMSWQRG